MNLEDEMNVKLISGNTNRPTIRHDSRCLTDTVKIEKLIRNFVERKKTDLASYIDDLVKGFNDRLCLTNQIFYRAVDSSTKICSNQIGPSPNSSDGRYNIDGETCIYLIDTIDFLYKELGSSSILIQQYIIPVNTFKIADLSPNNKNIHNSLALTFDMAERGEISAGYNFEKELEGREKSRYLVSQLIALSFKQYGWDGLYIPGVHGKPGSHYHNLVIFNTIVDKWENWAKGSPFLETKK